MATITTILSTDLITNSRAVFNTNFANLNSDKMETSVLDTDTTLAANSDAKVATQKAVKAYVDTLGNVNASTTTRGIVEMATQAEVDARTATGGSGAKLVADPSLIPYVKKSSGVLTKDISSSTTTTIAHGLGVAPRIVRVVGMHAIAATTTENIVSDTQTVWAGSQVSISRQMYLSPTAGNSSFAFTATFRIAGSNALSKYIEGVVTVDATNITITWTLTSTPTGTASLIWDAEQ